MKKTLLTIALGFLTSFGLQAQTIAAWDFTGPGNTATADATTFNANLVVSKKTLTRGSGAPATTAINSFRTQGFGMDEIKTSNTDFFEINLQATPGNKLNLANINAYCKGTPGFAGYPTGTGVRSQFAYSLDGTNFKLIGSPKLTKANSSGEAGFPEQSLTSIDELQNVPSTVTVTIRYYAQGETSTGGWGFFSASPGSAGLAIGGTVTAGVPPSFAANFPTTANIDQTKFDLLSNINTVGNTYYVVLPDGGNPPSATQVWLGQNSDGTIASISGSFYNEIANTTYSKNISGLSAGVPYDVYVVARDLNDNLQAQAVKIDFVTTETPLPVNLTAFNAKASDGNIILQWTTASEQENQYFEIQHSADGKIFTKIGEIDGAGTSTIPNYYSFVDENPNTGTNYYQLVQHDFNGKSSLSGITALNSQIEGSQLNVYAGSSKIRVFISSANQTDGKLQIFEIGGKRLFTKNINLDRGYNAFDLPLSVQPGIHFVKFTSESEDLIKKFLR